MTSLAGTTGLRPLLTAELAASLARATQGVAIPWLVLESGGSAVRVGVVMTAELVPMLLCGIPLGLGVQRVGARRWMIGSDVLTSLVVATTAALSLAGALPFWGLVTAVAVVGALLTPYMGSQQDVLSQLVAHDDRLLAKATSIMQGASRTSVLVGPPLAGVLVAWLGAAAALLVTVAVLVVVVLIVTLAVPSVRRHPEAPPKLLDGFRELQRDRLVRTWTWGSAFSEAAYQALFVAIPVMTVTVYDADAALAGTLSGCFGGGAVAGSLAASWLAERVPLIRLAVVGKLAQGVVYLALILQLPPVAAAATLAALGVANGLTNGPAGALRIARLDPRQRGNALTVGNTVIMGGGAFGAAAAGPLLGHGGVGAMFTVMTAAMAAACALFVRGAAVADRIDSNTCSTHDGVHAGRPSGLAP